MEEIIKTMKKAEKKAPVTPERKKETVKVTAARLNVRMKPSVMSEPVEEVTAGTELEKLGEVVGLGFEGQPAEWIKTRKGYVMKEFVV